MTNTLDKQIVIRSRAVIFHDNKLLVVAIGDHGFYALPGGHADWGENIQDALVRELVEELGVKPEIGRLLYVNNFTEKESVQSVEFFFEIKNSQDYLDTAKLHGTHSFELSEICWVNIDSDPNILPKQLQYDFKNGQIMSDTVRFLG